MGLDMMVRGRRYPRIDQEQIDGFPVVYQVLELAYWRKHPNLHGYIVQTFNRGVDDCTPILLNEQCLLQLIAAIESDFLPYTDGFFFGESDTSEEQKAEDLKKIRAALDWLKTKSDDVFWREVYYEASW